MLADHQRIKVSAHLEDKRGIYQIVMSWNDLTGERRRKSISTGLTIKGNKKRAEDLMIKARMEQETKVNTDPVNTQGAEMLFADYMEQWLDVIRPDLKLTTFGNHQSMVKGKPRHRCLLTSGRSPDERNPALNCWWRCITGCRNRECTVSVPRMYHKCLAIPRKKPRKYTNNGLEMPTAQAIYSYRRYDDRTGPYPCDMDLDN